MKTVDRSRHNEAARATPWAWFPAEAATISSVALPAATTETRLYAPRILNDPVLWNCSGLTNTGRPASWDRAFEYRAGVGRMTPSSRLAASSISSKPTRGLIGTIRPAC